MRPPGVSVWFFKSQVPVVPLGFKNMALHQHSEPDGKSRCAAYAFGAFRLEVAERRLRHNGQTILCPPRAFDVLVALVERAGSLVNKNDLLQQVWADTIVEEANLVVAISTLRRILGPGMIETVPKFGYRFIAAVGRLKTGGELTSSVSVFKTRDLGWSRIALKAGAALVVLIVALLPWSHATRSRARGAAVSVTQLTHTLAPDTQVSSGPAGRLVFQSERDGNPEIYTADAEGHAVKRLTNSPGRDEFPRWSPDGKQIAFASDRGGDGLQVYVMSSEGTDVRAMTHLPLACSEPAWSPDGRRLAFRRNNSPEDGGQDIYTIAIDGTDLRRLTNEPSNEVAPAWSPDGRAIAFASNRGRSGEFDLFQIDAHGGAAEPLTSMSGDELSPAWSSDGSELAFVSNLRGGAPELYVMEVAGGATRRLVTGEAEHPSWSFDGTSLVYSSSTPGNPEILRVELDAASPLPVSEPEAEDVWPSWSPSGRSLVFTSNRDGKRARFEIDVSTGAERKLTDGTANDWFPTWAPDGRRIAFQSDRAGDGLLNLCVMTLDSLATRCITSGQGTKGSPAWSPDGQRIAFQSNRDGAPYDFRIYTIAPDGSALIRLTSGPGYDGDPAWSPDGSRIAFTSNRNDQRFAVFTMNNDGTDIQRLTGTKHHNTNPWWSPDGKWIVYTDWRQGGNDLFVVPFEGGPAMRLTYRGGSWPRWSPRGDALVFTSSRRGHPGLFLMGVPQEFVDYISPISKR